MNSKLIKAGRFLMTFSDSTPPAILYKFLSPELVKNVLEQGTAKFTQMAKTNDEFEVRQTFNNVAGPKLDQMFAAMKSEKLQQPVLDEAFARKLAREFGRDFTPSEIELAKEVIGHDTLYNTVSSLMDQFGEYFRSKLNHPQTIDFILNEYGEQLLCFSLTETFDNSTMWGMYSDNSSGFVIGFNSNHAGFKQKADPSKSRLRKVTYFDGMLDEVMENPDAAFGSKTTNWSHEREWRTYCGIADIEKTIATLGDPIHLISFPPELVHSIIIGAKASQETTGAIKKIAADRYPHVQLSTAKPNNRTASYELNPVW
jgi:hypothetical protein